MTEHEHQERADVAPGLPHDSLLSETLTYVLGLGLALVLTGVSFWVASTSSLWGPGVATGLVVLAFGVLIVFLVMVGTIWIMGHMNANMMPDPALMNLHMQRG
jgi:cytochrome o ubiquinol oxidase operon protein cyoD